MRRQPDMRHPAPEPIGFLGWFLVMLTTATVLAIFAALFMVFLLVKPVGAKDIGQWQGSNPIIRQWYKSLMQPDYPTVSCCGEADGYWADKLEIVDGKVFAIITDTRPDGPLNRIHVPVGTRIEVPPHKITWKYGNPTGHTVIFLSAARQVLCYVQNGGV